MSTPNEPTRIIIDKESDWTRASTNVKDHASLLTETRLGKLGDGDENEVLKKEVRARIEKVGLSRRLEIW
jgi:hypothetical protein